MASVDGAGVGHARARRQLDREQQCGCCPRPAGSPRAADRSCRSRPAKISKPQRHRLVVVRDRPAHEPGVGAAASSPPCPRDVWYAHEVGGQQRRDEPRHQQREEHREGDDQAELLEVLPGDAAHEAHRHEHGDDGQGDGDDGEADLVGGLQRGAIGRLAHAHVAHDVLDLDDGVVDQDAGDDGDGEQADEVEREAGCVDRPECRDDGQRQRDGGDQRRAPDRAGR